MAFSQVVPWEATHDSSDAAAVLEKCVWNCLWGLFGIPPMLLGQDGPGGSSCDGTGRGRGTGRKTGEKLMQESKNR